MESKCIQGFEKGLPTKQLVQKALPQILALAKGFANKDLIVVSCADDPGVDEIRRMFPEKPVLGAGECTAALASLYGKKIAAFGRNILYSESFWKDAGGQDNRDGNAGRRTEYIGPTKRRRTQKLLQKGFGIEGKGGGYNSIGLHGTRNGRNRPRNRKPYRDSCHKSGAGRGTIYFL